MALMIRQDYIMRMIEQLVKVLAKILFNKKEGSYQEAINNVDTAFKNILGLDFNLLNALSAKDIISLLEIAKDNSSINIKCIVIAKLLKERADIKNISNKKSVKFCLRLSESIKSYFWKVSSIIKIRIYL